MSGSQANNLVRYTIYFFPSVSDDWQKIENKSDCTSEVYSWFICTVAANEIEIEKNMNNKAGDIFIFSCFVS